MKLIPGLLIHEARRLTRWTQTNSLTDPGRHWPDRGGGGVSHVPPSVCYFPIVSLSLSLSLCEHGPGPWEGSCNAGSPGKRNRAKTVGLQRDMEGGEKEEVCLGAGSRGQSCDWLTQSRTSPIAEAFGVAAEPDRSRQVILVTSPPQQNLGDEMIDRQALAGCMNWGRRDKQGKGNPARHMPWAVESSGDNRMAAPAGRGCPEIGLEGAVASHPHLDAAGQPGSLGLLGGQVGWCLSTVSVGCHAGGWPAVVDCAFDAVAARALGQLSGRGPGMIRR